MGSVEDAVELLLRFKGDNLKHRIAGLEGDARSLDGSGTRQMNETEGIDSDLLQALRKVKLASSQIDVAIHAAGILAVLPHILEPGEVIESLSLGAGNTGRAFDVETSHRVAEFKFINWAGGSETIRQNQTFKDFFYLAEHHTSKKRQLALLGLEHPLKFFNGRRSISTVLNTKRVTQDFRAKYGERFERVRDYFATMKDRVEFVDVTPFVPELAALG